MQRQHIYFWIIMVVLVLLGGICGYLIGRPVLRDTGAPIVSYPLMDAGGFAAPQTGTITGCVSVVRSAQSFSKSEWQLVIERWPIFEKYTEPCLYVDRTGR
jgi:hypothetical protein